MLLKAPRHLKSVRPNLRTDTDARGGEPACNREAHWRHDVGAFGHVQEKPSIAGVEPQFATSREHVSTCSCKRPARTTVPRALGLRPRKSADEDLDGHDLPARARVGHRGRRRHRLLRRLPPEQNGLERPSFSSSVNS